MRMYRMTSFMYLSLRAQTCLYTVRVLVIIWDLVARRVHFEEGPHGYPTVSVSQVHP